MSAKSLIRYRSEVGATDPLSGQQWHGGHENQGKKSPTGSLASDGASVESSSPESRGTILEEDSFDEGIDDILAQNPSCNLCGHNFYNTSDFLSHVRMHFSGGGGKRAEDSERKRKADVELPGVGKTQRTSPPPYRQPVGRLDDGGGDQVVDYSAQQSPREVEEDFHRQPSPPAAQHPPPQSYTHPPQSHSISPTPPQSYAHPPQSHSISPTPPQSYAHPPQSHSISPTPPQSYAHPPQSHSISPTPPQSYAHPPQSHSISPTPPQPSPDQVAPDNAALFDLLNSQYNQQTLNDIQNAQLPPAFGFNLNFPNNPFLHAPTIPQLPMQMPNFGSNPFHPNLPTYSPHPLLNPVPAQTFKCFACPATFDKREAFLYHLNFHSSYMDASETAKQAIPPNMSPFFPNFHQSPENNFHYNPNTNRRPKQSYSSTPSPHSSPYPSPQGNRSPDCTRSPRCTCNNCATTRQNKKAKKQVEDIDPETLKKITALEWERKHGYWCTKCKKRFASQAKLVDHMSYSVEHNYKESEKKRKSSESSSQQPSPASSEMSLLSPLNHSVASPASTISNDSMSGNNMPSDIMSVLSPGLSDLPI